MAIALENMSKEEFTLYFEDKVERYSKVLLSNKHEVNNETPSFEARNKLNNLLPEGVDTSNHHLFNICIDNTLIGFVWVKIEREKKSAFLYEIFIFENYRGRGVGTSVMKNLEKWLEEEDIYYFKLHVFGSNEDARRLYEELGFKIAGVNMLKNIGGGA
ncbi:GNAT family N-acetyltransferase [Halobacillus sp. MO56]